MLRRVMTLSLTAVLISSLIVLSNYFTGFAQERPRPDLKPIANWNFTLPTQELATGTTRIKITGTTTDPKVGLKCDGVTTKAIINPEVTPADPLLPKQAFSIVTLVRIDQPLEYGGFLGAFQDNGDYERGFVMGYHKEEFFLAITSRNPRNPSEGMTYHTSKAKYRTGQWYHLVGTYDGVKSRIYINGVLDSEDDRQAGELVYAPKAPFVVGRYQDDNEDFPLTGAIRDVQLFHRALTVSEINADFLAASAITEQAAVEQRSFLVNPYLQYATMNSIVIMAETPTPMTSEVRYGTKIPMENLAKNETASTMQEIPLAKLLPGTKYFYQMIARGADAQEIAGPVSTFQTAVDSTQAITFAIIGDTQKNPIITGKIAKLIWEARPNFVVHMGDVVDNGPDKKEWTEELFRPCQELFSRVCVYPCIGNHEKNHAHYYQYFSLPAPEFYYNFRFGNAEFFSLDTNKATTTDQPQHQWLDKALSASIAKWKFCFHHHPCYSSDSDDYGNTFQGDSRFGDTKARQFVGLYEKHNIDMAMNGHIHVYERTWPLRGGKIDTKKGIVYLTSGGGGGGLETFSPVPTNFKNQHRSTFHFCLVNIFDNTLQLKAFDQEGKLFDSFELKK